MKTATIASSNRTGKISLNPVDRKRACPIEFSFVYQMVKVLTAAAEYPRLLLTILQSLEMNGRRFFLRSKSSNRETNCCRLAKPRLQAFYSVEHRTIPALHNGHSCRSTL